jgi:phosphoribosylanthranilate isomerase
MKLKVCGMKYADNIREVAKLSPDFMGFIFYPKSKRFVGDDFIMPEISSEIKKVGVFVNDSVENISDKVKKYNLSFVQLHGDESADFCKRISEEVKVIKAFGIDDDFDFSILKKYENCCEYFLFDTKSDEYGGSGKDFDRNLLWNYRLSKPYFLSGGISLEEVRNQKSEVRNAYALDVNSKFETKPGFKDIKKLKLLKDELSGK